MKRRFLTVACAHVLAIACLVLFALSASKTSAHTGRRFTVEVVNSELQAQGVNTGASDGAPSIRPYLNIIHDHWKNDPSLDQAYATLPRLRRAAKRGDGAHRP